MNPHKMKRYVITIKNSSNVIIFYLFLFFVDVLLLHPPN